MQQWAAGSLLLAGTASQIPFGPPDSWGSAEPWNTQRTWCTTNWEDGHPKESRWLFCMFRPACLIRGERSVTIFPDNWLPHDEVLARRNGNVMSRDEFAEEVFLDYLGVFDDFESEDLMRHLRIERYRSWETFKASHEILWLNGTSVLMGKGLPFGSFFHRMQPYLEAFKALQHTQLLRGAAHGAPDAVLLLKSTLRSDARNYWVAPLLSRNYTLTGVADWLATVYGDQPELLHKACSGKGRCIPSSPNATLLVTLEEYKLMDNLLKQVSAPTKKEFALCMNSLSFAGVVAPLRPASAGSILGFFRSPLSATADEMDAAHRLYIGFHGSDTLKDLYATPIDLTTLRQPCQITLLNRLLYRRIENYKDVREAIFAFIASKKFLGPEEDGLFTLFETQWDSKPFAEQTVEAASTCVLISPHGAAFSNMIHMRKGSLIIEINPPRFFWPRLRVSAEQLGIRFASLWFEDAKHSFDETASNSIPTLGVMEEKRVRVNIRNYIAYKVDPSKIIAHLEEFFLNRFKWEVLKKAMP